MYAVALDNTEDFLPENCSKDTILRVVPLRNADLINYKIKLEIPFGQVYSLCLNTKIADPKCKFSFKKYDFGACLVKLKSKNAYSTSLVVKNLSNEHLFLENCTMGQSNGFSTDFISSNMKPFEEIHIPIHFYPLEIGNFQREMIFNVNSVDNRVFLSGQSVEADIKLLNIEDSYLDFGTINLGKFKRRTITIYNNSEVELSGFVDLLSRLPKKSDEKLEQEFVLPVLPTKLKSGKSRKSLLKSGKSAVSTETKTSKKGKKEKSPKKAKTPRTTTETVQVESEEAKHQRFMLEMIQLNPNQFHLSSKSSIDLEIKVFPKENIEEFKETLFYEINGRILPLCIVAGHIKSKIFTLTPNSLSFNNIIVGCTHTLHVLLANEGNSVGRFVWLTEESRNFTLQPTSGVILPGNLVKIAVEFHPKDIHCLIKENVQCFIENLEQPLDLILTGNSLPLPAPTETLKFQCPVRQMDTKSVKISNNTLNSWNLEPILQGASCFKTQNQFNVESNSDYLLKVQYEPKEMIKEFHTADLILKIPEGKIIMYTLLGKTLPPIAEDQIKRTIQAKTMHYEMLSIKNSLNIGQTLTVTTDLLSTLEKNSLYKIAGSKTIDLPANETKLYQWGVCVINEMQLQFRVTFTNESSMEYSFYDIALNVINTEFKETIKLSTCVRKKIGAEIKLENPINVPVSYVIETNAPYLTSEKLIEVQPYSICKLFIEFYPLKTMFEKSYILKTKCIELGTNNYNVILTATKALPEKTVSFSCELGESDVKFIAINLSDFNINIDKPEYVCEITQKNKLTIQFKPSECGRCEAKLVLTSNEYGDYIYPLVGEAIPPTPKGPYNITPTVPVTIQFWNPFMTDENFLFNITSPFYLKHYSEEIKSRRQTKIVVFMQHSEQKHETTGKLLVTCQRNRQITQWKYYFHNNMT